MHRAAWLAFILELFLLAGLPATATAQDCPRGGTLIAGAGDYRPYNIVEGDKVSGMDFDVIETILKDMGCDLLKVPLPWARHLNGLRNGSVDIATPVTKTPDREVFAHFSAPYIVADEILFVRTDDTEAFESLEDFFLRGKRLGVIRNYAYGGSFPKLANAYPHLIERTDSLELNLKQLQIGRVDAILGETLVVTSVIRRLGYSNTIKTSGVIVASEPNHIMFSKKSVSQAFVAAFSEKLQLMQANGTFDEITAPYRSTDGAIN